MDVSDIDFEKQVVEKSKDLFVLVDFWATWCAPCLMFKPVLEKVVEEYKDRVVLVKVNVDESPESSDKYSVNAIPAIKLFRDGKVIAEFAGLKSEVQLKDWLDEHLK